MTLLSMIVLYVMFLPMTVHGHTAPVDAPWKIPPHQAHSFLTVPTRHKRSDPRCNTDEPYCESNKASCMQHNEQSREYYCGLGHSCPTHQACYLSTPCPAHYVLGCTDDNCLSFPCHNGGTCQDITTGFTCQCVPGFNSTTACETDYNECHSSPCLNGGSCNNLFNQFSCSCTDRYQGDICEQDCRPGPADIVFIVDTSSSVEHNVNASISFIGDFVKKVPIGPNDFQVGVITYNFKPEVLFDLDDHTSEADILTELNKIKGEEAVTFTAPAVQKAIDMLQSSTMGTRPGVASYVVLLYDGLSSDQKDAVSIATSFKSMGGKLLTVGIGQSVSYNELLLISSKQEYTFNHLHLEDMYSRILRETVHQNCTDCSLQTGSDILILLDTNRNQTIAGFAERKTVIRKTIEKVLSYNSDAKIGMYTYSDEIEEEFSLSWSRDKDQMIAEALKVDIDVLCSESNTSHALQHIRNNPIFQSPRKIVLIISDGHWSEQSAIKTEISSLEQNGIEVFGVVAGDDSVLNYNKSLFVDETKLFYVLYNNFTPIDALAAVTTYYTCDNNIFLIRQ